MKRETSYPERLVPSLWNLQWKTEVHLHNTCGTCLSSPGKKPRASTSCPLRRAMLCHCGLVAAAVSTSLLMSIGSAVSLLPDDGHNATVLCFWPQNKAAPSRSPIPGPSAIILMQTPWVCESAGKCPFRGRRGWGHGCNQWEHLQFLGWARWTLPGAVRGHFGWVWHGSRGSFIKGELAEYQGESNKSKSTREQPWCKELVPFLGW